MATVTAHQYKSVIFKRRIVSEVPFTVSFVSAMLSWQEAVCALTAGLHECLLAIKPDK